jgi:hypothetical protein
MDVEKRDVGRKGDVGREGRGKRKNEMITTTIK